MKLLLFIELLISLATVLCWTNFRIFYRSVTADYVNPSFLTVHKHTVKSYNRSFTYMIHNSTLLKTAIGFKGNARFYKYQSNNYQEQFLPISIDMCLFLKNQGNGGEDKLSKTFIAALAKPLRNIYNTKGNKFPKTCPVEPQEIFLMFHVDEDALPKFFLPQGKWRIWVQVMNGNVAIFSGSLYFEIIEYSSEKQMHKLG